MVVAVIRMAAALPGIAAELASRFGEIDFPSAVHVTCLA